MREIKFRAAIKETGEVFPVSTIWLNSVCVDMAIGDYPYNSKVFNLDDIELIQYTGLKDKNGTEIYEGDILKVFEILSYRTLEYTSSVEFIESGFLVTEPDDCQVPLACFHNPECAVSTLFEIEVIGNIFENPELLGGEVNV